MGAVGNRSSGCPRYSWSCAPIWAAPGFVLAPCAAQQPQPLLTPVPGLLEPGAGSYQRQVSLASCTCKQQPKPPVAVEGSMVSSSHPRGPQAQAASDERKAVGEQKPSRSGAMSQHLLLVVPLGAGAPLPRDKG